MSPRRGITLGVGVVAVLLSVASVASACTVKYGQTYYSDETTSKSVAYGGTITFHAHGAVYRSGTARFVGVTGLNSQAGHDVTHPCMDSLVGETGTVASTSSGNIGNNSAVITRTRGIWQVCYYETTSGNYGSTSTGAALLTVT
jgi:hypothetical protein